MISIRTLWQRITARRDTRARKACTHEECALREEVARQCAELARLRAENRALLNSILGIAGVPPLPVDRGAFVEPQLYPERAAHGTADVDSAPSYTPVIPRPRSSTAEESAVGSEIQKQIPRRPQDGLSRDDSVVSNGSGLPSSFDGRPPRRPAPLQNHSAAMKTMAVPMRRRSWQQINRMLEFDAARKTVTKGD
jgi:hypothetical protein